MHDSHHAGVDSLIGLGSSTVSPRSSMNRWALGLISFCLCLESEGQSWQNPAIYVPMASPFDHPSLSSLSCRPAAAAAAAVPSWPSVSSAECPRAPCQLSDAGLREQQAKANQHTPKRNDGSLVPNTAPGKPIAAMNRAKSEAAMAKKAKLAMQGLSGKEA